jgi:hypothetical protein
MFHAYLRSVIWDFPLGVGLNVANEENDNEVNPTGLT